MTEDVSENPITKTNAPAYDEDANLINDRLHLEETGNKETSVLEENLIDSIVSLEKNEGAIEAKNPQICTSRNIIDSIIDDGEESDTNESLGDFEKVNDEVKMSSNDRMAESEPNVKMLESESDPGMKVDLVDKISQTWEDIVVRRVAKQMQMK